MGANKSSAYRTSASDKPGAEPKLPRISTSLEDHSTSSSKSSHKRLCTTLGSVPIPPISINYGFIHSFRCQGQSRPHYRRCQRNRSYDLRRIRSKWSESIHLIQRRKSLRAGMQGVECSGQRKRRLHPSRSLQSRRLQEDSRGVGQTRDEATCSDQQLWIKLGGSIRRVS